MTKIVRGTNIFKYLPQRTGEIKEPPYKCDDWDTKGILASL